MPLRGVKSKSHRGAKAELDPSAVCDTNMCTGPTACIETRNEPLFDCSGRNEIDWCPVYLNYDWEGIACSYHDNTGKDFWEEATAMLNAAEPAFKARHGHSFYRGDYISVDNVPEKSQVERFKQFLVEMEPRFTCYSVPKLTWLLKEKLVKPRYGMQAVVEYYDNFGKDATLQMLETHLGDILPRFY